jgi:hypothetical protein
MFSNIVKDKREKEKMENEKISKEINLFFVTSKMYITGLSLFAQEPLIC